jgi:DNA-binding CsgD family transcriptional regulator
MRPSGGARVLVGRGDEVRRLHGLVLDVTKGRGRCVWMEGEPGIGKSRLLAAGLADAQRLGCQVRWASADELGQRFPLRVMLDLPAQLPDLSQAAAHHCGGDVPRTTLSNRERQALEYIARGFTHQQTASRMGVSKATVDTYIARIRTKLRLGNKAELALAALRYVEPRHRGAIGQAS